MSAVRCYKTNFVWGLAGVAASLAFLLVIALVQIISDRADRAASHAVNDQFRMPVANERLIIRNEDGLVRGTYIVHQGYSTVHRVTEQRQVAL